MVYFSVPMDCKSICPCHACVVCSLSFIFVCIQLLHISWRFSSVWHWLIPLSNLWFMLVRMAALVSGWGLRSQAEKTGCDKTLKPGAQHLSILAGVMWHWSGRVATAAQQPNHSANHDVSLTPGNKSFPFFIRFDLYFLQRIEQHRFMTLCMLWHREERDGALKGANQIKVLQTEWRQQKGCTDLMLLLLCQKTVSIQRETISHSITCSMCAFQSFIHSGVRASPVFHTHPHLQHSVVLPVKTGLKRVCPACVCIHVLLHLYNLRVISVLKVCFSKHTVKHVPVLWPLYIWLLWLLTTDFPTP